MKKIFLILVFLLWAEDAPAVCSGGFDGTDATLSGCSEMGALGDLLYKRNDRGMVIGKRSNAEIKTYLISVVEDRLKSRGVTMKDQNGQSHISINEKEAVFDLFSQNGDKVYTYTVDLESGIPENEKELIASRNAYNAKKAAEKKERKDRIAKMQELAEKIKVEEIDNKAAAGK